MGNVGKMGSFMILVVSRKASMLSWNKLDRNFLTHTLLSLLPNVYHHEFVYFLQNSFSKFSAIWNIKTTCFCPYTLRSYLLEIKC